MDKEPVLTEAVYYILLSLMKPCHGYGIMQNTESLTNGRIKLAAGTLYGALNALIAKGWIQHVESNVESRKKEYLITDSGYQVVLGEISRLESLLNNGKRIIGENNEEGI